ncbi:TPA: hypothetical protein DCR49_05800 [Candidatus Delongbacteria bacterium]|nr:MAG: hypothetical protein A2Y39_04090 [Candidatus Delongbacteria bacterium GWF2_40_14]HAQ61499.1 hypothetical protein [Candidatus Delongbacteria bacterium]
MKSMMLIMTALFFCSSVFAESYIKDYSSGKRLYEFDGKYVKSYRRADCAAEFVIYSINF